MTSADELRITLSSLADLCARVVEDLQDTAWPASAGSNAGAAPTGQKSKPPCSIVSLDYLTGEVEPLVRGWCRNLVDSAQVTLGDVVGRPINVWVAWLSRHRALLLDQEWGEDAAVELGELESELRHRLYPTEPNFALTVQQLPDLCTAEQLCDAFGVKQATIRKWKERGKVIPAGTQTLSTGQTLELLRWPKPEERTGR